MKRPHTFHKLSLAKPDYMVPRGICITAEGQDGAQKLRANYEMRPAFMDSGGRLVIPAGSITAEPTGIGVGSSFLEGHIHPLFRQAAARADTNIEHRELVSNTRPGPGRFYLDHHDYIYDSGVSDVIKREFSPDEPKELSPEAEEILKYLLGTRYMTAAEAAKRRAKK